MLALVVHGVPMQIAEMLEPWELWGWNVIVGEINGGEYDWGNRKWKEPHQA